MKTIKYVLLAFLMVGVCANVSAADPLLQRQRERAERLDEAAEEMLIGIAQSVGGFYAGMAQVAVEGLRQAMQDESEMRRAEARGKADALKFAAAASVIMKSLTDGRNLAKISGSVVLGAAGISSCYFVSKLAFNYLNALIGKPTLIRDTSIKPGKDRLIDFLLGRKPAPSRFDEIVLDADLDFKLKEIADTLEMGIADGEGVRHILLTGPAGTGKTMFAKAVAMRLNQRNIRKDGKRIPVHYACCAGADFAQFEAGKDIVEMHKIIDFAMKSEGITILFIDEIDSLLKNRLDSLATEASINRTNTFLSVFDKPTHDKIVVIGATNFEHKIDRAAFSRFSKKVAFTLPQGETLARLFDQYIEKEVVSKGIKLDESFVSRKNELLALAAGLSPRTIEDISNQMYTRLRFMRSKELTFDVAAGLIKEAQEAAVRNERT